MGLPKRRIAASYLPSRYHYWYSLSKLAMDPLHDAASRALSESRAPLLDVGCGIGLLLQCLRASGNDLPYTGIDSDATKVAIAREACQRQALRLASFEVRDVTTSFPDHHGSVALLDMLQYLDADAQQRLIANAAHCIAADGQLVIRGGLADGSWRAALTRATDRFGHAVRWMDTPFREQPTAEQLTHALKRHGLKAQFRPLWGRTPFNNWLVIAHRY